MRFTNDVSSSIFFSRLFQRQSSLFCLLDDVSLRKESAARLFYLLSHASLFFFYFLAAGRPVYAIFFVFARKNEGRRHFWSPTA